VEEYQEVPLPRPCDLLQFY